MKYAKQVIYGQIPSKSNQYRIVKISNSYTMAKSNAIKEYEKSFMLQCGIRNTMIEGFFKLDIDVYFQSNRSDIDNSIKVLADMLQTCKVIKNDRQCLEIHIRKLIDKNNPRVEFVIEEVEL